VYARIANSGAGAAAWKLIALILAMCDNLGIA
jgi:hypothetical protein